MISYVTLYALLFLNHPIQDSLDSATVSMDYLLYKEIPFLAMLASMSFFKRSGTYNLYCFGRVGYKNDVKTTNKYGNTCLLCQHLILGSAVAQW